MGSTLAKAFKESNPEFEIFGIDNFVRPGSWLNKKGLDQLNIRVYHGDIRQESDLALLPKADWVIDAAANPSVLAGVDGKSSSLQLVQNNLFGTVNLLEYCKRHKAGFILLSTSRVYSIPGLATLRLKVVKDAFFPDTEQEFPPGISLQGVSEEYSVLPPVSLYGSTKVCSEHLAMEYGATFDFPVWINRCGVLAGPGQFGHPGQGIFAYWIHSFREQCSLNYIGFNGTGYQVRDCLHPKDLVPLLKKQFNEPLNSAKPKILNFSGGIKNSMSLKQLSVWCQKHIGDNIVNPKQSTRPFDIPWMVLDSTRAKDVWNWEPETSIEDVLLAIAIFAGKNDNWSRISESGY